MKKIILILTALVISVSVSACGSHEETAEDYADKLASGEIIPDVKTAEKTEEKTAEPESEATRAPAPQVSLGISEAEMGAMLDEGNNAYKSFTIQPIDSPDFFVNKQLRVVSKIEDHQMTFLYDRDIETKFSDGSLVIRYKDESGSAVEQNYIVYAVADHVAVSPEGSQYSYVAYGDQEITSEKTDGTIGIVSLIKMREDVDMGEGAADSYIMLQETSNKDVYEIFKVMD